MTDVNKIYEACIEAPALSPGLVSKLSSFRAEVEDPDNPGQYIIGQKPAIARFDKRRPDFDHPYIILDTSTRTKGAWSTNRFMDEEEGQLVEVTETDYNYFITYICYGATAIDVMGELEEAFKRFDVLQRFSRENMELAETFPISTSSTVIDNKIRETASMIVRVSVCGIQKVPVPEIQGLDIIDNLNLKIRGSEDNLIQTQLN